MSQNATPPTLRTIAILGSESSGKTTLCQTLAQRLNCPWAQEYARFYQPMHAGQYTEADLLNILHGQKMWQQQAWTLAQQQNAGAVIFDTEATVLLVWAQIGLGSIPAAIQRACAEQSFTDYLLLAPDLPWQPDPLRSAPDPTQRQAIFAQYAHWLRVYGRCYQVIHGQGEERIQNALTALHLSVAS